MSKKFLELLLPYPRIINELNGNFNINEKVTARISSKCEKSFEYWLGKFGIKNIETIESNDFSIIIGDENTISKPNSDNKEAYKIFVSEKGISVSANQEIGLSYAIRTLVKVQILEKNIPCMIIEDEPMVAFRGIHMCLFNYNDGSEKDDTHPDVVIKRIELAALMGYNHVFIEFWGMFPYEKHPYACFRCSDYTKEKIEEIVNHCINDLHIIPLHKTVLAGCNRRIDWECCANRVNRIIF